MSIAYGALAVNAGLNGQLIKAEKLDKFSSK
jgi:hypothetical protein